ncbi:MAG: hypothetical protein IKU37_07070 [Candidatus Gastranaerophilales bacterium]|nr:hypothetical protein [Candidatus Gastranaerophilales bacterium]
MRMIQKLKLFEQTVVFLRWATDAQFGKILYVGEDFIEFLVLNQETMEYDDKILINSQLILEVVLSGYEVAKLIAELSVKAVNPLDINDLSL